MKSHYTCGKCNLLLEAGDKHFFTHSLKKVSNNSNLTVIGQCKACAKQYATKWRSDIKAKGLVRSQKNGQQATASGIGQPTGRTPSRRWLRHRHGRRRNRGLGLRSRPRINSNRGLLGLQGVSDIGKFTPLRITFTPTIVSPGKPP